MLKYFSNGIMNMTDSIANTGLKKLVTSTTRV
jgi:hypothetical protein